MEEIKQAHAWNISGFLSSSALAYPLHPALVDKKGRTTCYQELEREVNSLANALSSLGIKKGDKVGIYFYNSKEFLASNFAVARIGAVSVPVNFRLAPPEITYQMDHADVSLLIYSQDFATGVRSIRSKLPKVKNYICEGKDQEALNYHELVKSFSPKTPEAEVLPDDDHIIYYTSGTTGLPKAVMLSHLNMGFTSPMLATKCGFRQDDRNMVVAPMFHLGAYSTVILSVFLGATIYAVKEFNPSSWYGMVEKERITGGFVVPSMTVALQNYPEGERYDVSSFRIYMSAAAPLLPSQKDWIRKRFPEAQLWDLYATMEVGIASLLSPEDQMKKTESVGKPIFQKTVLLDDEGNEVPIGEVGEIAMRGYGVCKDYHKNPEANREAFRHGWFRTGDMGRMDEDGYLFLVDRKKDMILTGGENVYSVEVENVLSLHPSIKECAVIGLHHQKWGEAVTAAVVLKEGCKVEEKELIDFVKKSIASYKSPKSVIFLDNFPKNPMGKILKRTLREMYKDKYTGMV